MEIELITTFAHNRADTSRAESLTSCNQVPSFMKMFRLASLASLMMALQSCGEEAPSLRGHHLTGEIKLQRFANGKKIVETKIIDGSRQHELLLQWLKKHELDWKPSKVTFAPQVKFRGEGFSINYLKSGEAVLNEWVPVANANHQFIIGHVAQPPAFVAEQ